MKKTISVILVLAALFGMVTVFAAGTETDPLITKSYVDSTYRDSFRDTIKEMGALVAAEMPMIDIRLDAANEHTGFSFSRGFAKKDLGYRTNITILPGSSFMQSSGTAYINFSSGSVINVSTGTVVASGTKLVNNQRYFCGEGTTATVTAMSVGSGYVDGYYKMELFQTTLFVERLYSEVLGRGYDEPGLQGWVDGIMTGYVSAAEVARGFIFSAELISRNLSNDAFVEMLYRTLMGRPSDPGGKAGWVGGLERGMTRQAVFNGFINSVEWDSLRKMYGLAQGTDVPVPTGTRIFVTRLYTEVLGRQPDLKGRNDWMRALQSGSTTGSEVARGFIFSTELTNRNLSNADFVEVLYKTLLGRPSDPGGKADWVNALNNGMTRQKVFDGFVASAEFTQLCRVLGVKK